MSMDGCHSSLSAAQPQSLPLASFLSCIFFLRYKGVLLYQNIMYKIFNFSVRLFIHENIAKTTNAVQVRL